MIMNGITDYKVWGPIFGTALFVLGLMNLSEGIFYTETPHAEAGKAGFLVEVAEAEENTGGGEAKPATPLPQLLAAANAENGAKTFKTCAACHNPGKGEANKTGPALYDVVERQIASHEGFEYSEGAKAKTAEKWTYENLNTFLTAPAKYIEGTKMKFAGIKDEAKRADVLAYLATLSDAPKPFPAP
jgi:cytochrome c